MLVQSAAGNCLAGRGSHIHTVELTHSLHITHNAVQHYRNASYKHTRPKGYTGTKTPWAKQHTMSKGHGKQQADIQMLPIPQESCVLLQTHNTSTPLHAATGMMAAALG